MSKNRRNTIWTYLIGLIMLASGFYIAYALSVALTTDDDCGENAPKTWIWLPPAWECGRR